MGLRISPRGDMLKNRVPSQRTQHALTTAISADKLCACSARRIALPWSMCAPRMSSKRSRWCRSSMWRPHADPSDWAGELTGRSAIVICQKGKLSQGAAAWLRHTSVPADALETASGWSKGRPGRW